MMGVSKWDFVKAYLLAAAEWFCGFLMILVVLVGLSALSGCANTSERAFYSQGFIGYRLADKGFESCSDENSGIRLGHEWRVKNNWKMAAEYEHISHTFCGRPFNDKPEASADHVGITITYGGLQ